MSTKKHQSKAKEPQPQSRLRLIQDDSSHWYAIPANLREKFNEWVESFMDENIDDGGNMLKPYTGPDFEEYRLSMHPTNYTFVDLQEED